MNYWRISTLILAATLVGIIGVGAITTASAEPQSHMRAALGHLERARTALEKAAPDKGGHRAKAIELTDQAMAETKAGIEYADKH